MSAPPSAVALCPWAEEDLGIRMALAPDLTSRALPDILDFCGGHRVALLVARCPANDPSLIHTLERRGFLLMDTQLVYERVLAGGPIRSGPDPVSVRPVREGEEEGVRSVAAEAFRGYRSHYSADERLDPRKCDALYASWAFRACLSRGQDEEVLVAQREGRIVAFALLRLNSPEEGQVLLGGTAPAYQGQGLRRSFVAREMEWCLEKGAKRLVMATQIHNLRSLAFWSRLGFEPRRALYTFHRWFDENPAAL